MPEKKRCTHLAGDVTQTSKNGSHAEEHQVANGKLSLQLPFGSFPSSIVRDTSNSEISPVLCTWYNMCKGGFRGFDPMNPLLFQNLLKIKGKWAFLGEQNARSAHDMAITSWKKNNSGLWKNIQLTANYNLLQIIGLVLQWLLNSAIVNTTKGF